MARTLGCVNASILISSESAMPLLVRSRSSRISFLNIHMPDCESTTNLRYSAIIVPERTALPSRRIGLFVPPCFEYQRRAVMKSTFFSIMTYKISCTLSGGYVPSPSIVMMMSPRAAA